MERLYNNNREQWRETMRIVLCNDGVCDPPKCPVVDIQDNQVTIGEKDNVCTLTREQFDILKEKIKNNEI
jgi:hypothetical protein